MHKQQQQAASSRQAAGRSMRHSRCLQALASSARLLGEVCLQSTHGVCMMATVPRRKKHLVADQGRWHVQALMRMHAAGAGSRLAGCGAACWGQPLT
jgi:hypothetical protein